MMYSTVNGVDGKETIANVVAFLSQILRGYYSDGPYICRTRYHSMRDR